MSRIIISENDRRYIKSLYNVISEDAQTIARDIYDASSGVGTDEDKFLNAVLDIDYKETYMEVDRILRTFDYGGGFNDYVDGELGIFDKDVINQIKSHIGNLKSKFNDGSIMRASQSFWDDIRKDEGKADNSGNPVLKAYRLGDGKITMGWGHAEDISTSKYKVGDTITMQDAEKYLREDAAKAADCVRRIMSEWKDKGISSYRITQNMFDVLVSLAFNAGCGGLRTSQFIQLVKAGKFIEAANSLPNDNTMMPANSSLEGGVKNRRMREAEKFKRGL